MQEIVTEHLLTQKDILTSKQEEELFHMMRKRNETPRPGGMRGGTGLGMGNGRGERPYDNPANATPNQE